MNKLLADIELLLTKHPKATQSGAIELGNKYYKIAQKVQEPQLQLLLISIGDLYCSLYVVTPIWVENVDLLAEYKAKIRELKTQVRAIIFTLKVSER